MRPQELIRRKRDGKSLTDHEIRALIAGVVNGSVPDYQLSALLMAVLFRGLDDEELASWTDAMVRSGRVLEFPEIEGPKVDKHSTGGVGDKVSICLAPLVAACGVYVPMISGRGLGHTGGTLDKLEAIPGFDTRLGVDRFGAVVADAGLSLIGQTDDLAPADRKLYALRDVTGTVESIPLICSSILSKKLAEGIDGLVLDVKVGSGAFMKRIEDARELARLIIAVGKRAGKNVSALITDMNQPLGRAVGNACETREAIEILRGGGPADLWEITARLGAEMLVLGGVAADEREGREQIAAARADGSGLARLRRCVELQSGDPRAIDDPGLLPAAREDVAVEAEREGVLAAVDTERVGIAAMLLGAGRRTVDDRIDPAVGLTMRVRIGDRVAAGQPLATLHLNDRARAAEAERELRAALSWSEGPSAPPPLVHEVVR